MDKIFVIFDNPVSNQRKNQGILTLLRKPGNLILTQGEKSGNLLHIKYPLMIMVFLNYGFS